jgi:hypothetical protein
MILSGLCRAAQGGQGKKGRQYRVAISLTISRTNFTNVH